MMMMAYNSSMLNGKGPLIKAVGILTMIAAAMAAASCNKKGPTDLKKLIPIVSSQTGKDEMDVIHKTHERAGIVCYKCHHKWENPDRIRNCTNCHRGKEESIARGTCLTCHEKKDSR
jgi:hypothetical protein